MLSYRNMLFCTDKVKSGIYPLRIILPGCKLSCSIFTFSCTDIDILLIDIDILRTTADGRLFLKMLQESLHPGKMILNGYIPLFTMSVQNSVFLYDSIVHPYYKCCSGEYIVQYTAVVSLDIYTQYDSVYTQYDSVYCTMYSPEQHL